MQVPITAEMKQVHADDREPIRCAEVARPTQAQRQKTEMLRFVVVAVAILAVLLLIAIALYYTQGNSVTIRHVSLLAPQFTLRA